jgi:pilus assembly protein Flp/PilA
MAGSSNLNPQESYMKNFLNRFVREDAGQDLIEYALLAGLISLVCVAAVTATGGQVKQLFEKVQAAVTSANTAAP